jgi:RNA polymerase sigma-32 factor
MSHQDAAFSLTHYRAEIGRVQPLTPLAERELAERVRRGDTAAARRLVEACLATVAAIAHEYRRTGLPLEDLVQEGNLGLMKAVERFDPGFGTRLATYAAYWIRAEIRAFVVRSYRIVKIGGVKGEHRALWLYRRDRAEDPEALAEKAGLTLDRATALLPLLQANDVSLTPPPLDSGRASLLDRLADRSGTPEDALADFEQRDVLRDLVDHAIDSLPPREQDIVRRRLLAEDPATLESLGSTWGVSKERVRQLEEQVKVTLARRLQKARKEAAPVSERRRKVR